MRHVRKASIFALALTLVACLGEPARPAPPPEPVEASQAAPAAEPAPATVTTTRPELVHHTVTADGHPLAVHARRPAKPRAAVLLVHGRTWSGLPDFDLQVEGASVSLMDALAAAGVAAYAIDLRGYGATPQDASGFTTPGRSADDVAAALRFVASDAGVERPYLLGWSMGALVSTLATQRNQTLVGGLVLYGYPCRRARDEGGKQAPPMRVAEPTTPARATNTAESAASDFITPNSTAPGVIDGFVAAALRADPVKADWRGGAEWEALRFAALRVPVLVLHGERDPVVDRRCMAERFVELEGVDRRWEILAGGDHAAHLERTAPKFVAAVLEFIAEP